MKTKLRNLKSNEVRLLKECAKLGLYHLPNGAHPKLEDKMFLIKLKNLLKLDNQSINIFVNSDFDKKTERFKAVVKRLTISKIIKEIGDENISLYKGKGYFYFVYTSLRVQYAERSVMVTQLNDLTLERWVEEGNELINELKIMGSTTE